MSDQKKSLLQMARGAIEERFDYEMTKILDNILDENTKATAPRKITLTVEIRPDDERRVLQVAATAKATLAPTNAVATSLYMAGEENGQPVAVEMTPQLPGQINLFGEELDQPESEFLVRVKEGGKIGLFEADGGAWKYKARIAARDYLREAFAAEIEKGLVVVSA